MQVVLLELCFTKVSENGLKMKNIIILHLIKCKSKSTVCDWGPCSILYLGALSLRTIYLKLHESARYYFFLSIKILIWCLPPRVKRTICKHNFKTLLKDTLVIFDISWALWMIEKANFLRIPSGNLKNTTSHYKKDFGKSTSIEKECLGFSFLPLLKDSWAFMIFVSKAK